MSDFIAEARVLVTPDTTKFRALLEEQLAIETKKPVIVPVQFASVGGAAGTAEQVAVQEKLTQSTARSTAATANAAKVEAADAEIRARLANVTDVAQLKVSQLAQKNAVLSESNKIAAASTRNVTAALALEDQALISAVAETEALATSQAAAARTATAEAVAQARNAEAAASTASAHALAAKGVGATGLSMLGARGATLAASSSFLVGAAAATILAKSVGGASGLNEEINKTKVTFRDSSEEILKWSETTATSLGISQQEALRAAGEFGNLLEPLGILPQRAADMSVSLVQLASDLASFHNADPSDMLERLRAGLAGQSRPLRIFGIQLLASRVNQEALNETGKRSVRQLTEQEKVLARYALILKDSKNAQGDFARTSDQLANESRQLKAELQDLGDTLGTTLIPGLRIFVGSANKLVAVVQTSANEAKDAKKSFLDFIPESVQGKLQRFVVSTGKGALSMQFFGGTLAPLIPLLEQFGTTADKSATQATTAFDKMAANIGEDIKALVGALSSLQLQLEKQLPLSLPTQIAVEQARGGTGLALLQQQLQRQEDFLDKLLEGPKTPKRQALIRRAAANVESTRSQIQAILDDQAAAAKKAAQEAQDARDKADAELLSAFDLTRQRQQNRIVEAAATKTLADDLARTIKLRDIILGQIKLARQRLHDRQLLKETLADLTDQLNQTKADIRAIHEQEAQALIDRQETARQAADLLVQIAQAQGNKKLEEKRLLAEIALLKAQIKNAKLTRIQRLQLKLDLANAEKDLKDLKKQRDKNSRAAQEEQFAFLQTQTGFAFNLLGNLIPGGATAGLVGGRGAAPGPRETAARIPLPAPRTTALADSRITRGITRGQGNEQIAILRSILKELHAANRLRDHPEAHNQRRRGAAIMDTAGSHGM